MDAYWDEVWPELDQSGTSHCKQAFRWTRLAGSGPFLVFEGYCYPKKTWQPQPRPRPLDDLDGVLECHTAMFS